MSVLEKISFYQNRRDETPNQELAGELAKTMNREGIAEIASHLFDKNKNVASDCLKVLYETGYLNPELIADHVDLYLDLLKSKNNRMVWGAMIALGTMAHLKPAVIWEKIEDVVSVTDNGTVITMVWGIRVLSKVAAADTNYNVRLFPDLLRYLNTCIPRDLPTHAESMLPAVKAGNRNSVLEVMNRRKGELTKAQLLRWKKIVKQIES